MLKGLEITEIRLSELWTENPTGRFDSEYFQKFFLENITTIEKFPSGWMRLGDAISELTGGATPLGADYPESGVRFLRVQNVMQNFIDDSDLAFISPGDDSALSRSRLKTDDVLLTITGVSYGKAAVVTPEFVGSNINQHSVRIELQPGTFEPFFVSTFLNSNPGKLQSDQNITGVTRPALDYDSIRRFRIPRVSAALQTAIARLVRDGQQQFARAKQTLTEAEEVLLAALGLGNWQPPEPLSYTRRASEAFAAGRLDSHYFAPRVAELLARLGKDGRTVRDVAPPRQEKFAAVGTGNFQYIEISDVRNDGTATSETLPIREAPSRATSYVRAGDVLTSTVRPNRRLSALILPEQDGCVASSGFVVLTPQAVPAEVLLTYLRLPLFCELMDLHTSASLYPAISDKDLLALPFPTIPAKASNTIVAAVRSAHTARQRAHELLAAAQRAVEIAIEDSETAALAYLKKQSK